MRRQRDIISLGRIKSTRAQLALEFGVDRAKFFVEFFSRSHREHCKLAALSPHNEESLWLSVARQSFDSEATPRTRRGAASLGKHGTWSERQSLSALCCGKAATNLVTRWSYRTNRTDSVAKSPGAQLVLRSPNIFVLQGERVAVIRPFNALRPQAERAAQVAAVPYDVVNTEEARALASGNPWSFLHVSRPEIDLPAGTPIYSDEVYAKAGDNFARLIRDCPLVVEETPSLYLYRLIMGNHEQIGVVACCSVDEYDRDIIRKHERTRRDKEDDRTRHIMVLRAQTGPVFLTYRDRPEISSLIADAQNHYVAR